MSAKEYYFHLIITSTIINYPMLYVNLKKGFRKKKGQNHRYACDVC